MAFYKDTPPLVSIIIPIYNGEAFIDRCLKSVMGQTYSKLEIICVVNGSTDASKQMIENYREKDSRIILLETDIGDLGRASNLGVEAAHGDYISFVDVDDWVMDNYIERLLTGMQLGYKICKSNLVFEDRAQDYLAYQEKKTGEIPLRSASWLLPCRTSAIYDKTVFATFRYLEFSYYEDLAAWPVMLGIVGTVYYLDEPLYRYNKANDSSIMNDRSDKHLVLDKVFAFIFSQLTDQMDRDVYLLVTALFIQSFWTSNVNYISSDTKGGDYLKRVQDVIRGRLVGYHYMVNLLSLPQEQKQKMWHFYQ